MIKNDDEMWEIVIEANDDNLIKDVDGTYGDDHLSGSGNGGVGSGENKR